jgi:hypothetical protein
MKAAFSVSAVSTYYGGRHHTENAAFIVEPKSIGDIAEWHGRSLGEDNE